MCNIMNRNSLTAERLLKYDFWNTIYIAIPIGQNSYFYDMITLQVDILNPKAIKLLENLEELKLISIRNSPEDDGFLKLVTKFRAKAKTNPPSLEDITKDVEIVRSKRYGESK